MFLAGTGCSSGELPERVTLATTTSLGNSGLLDVLLPAFERLTGARVRGHLVGSGLALQMLEQGQADLAISHAPEMEARLLAAYPGWWYRKLMYNHFLLVGPLDDPASAASAPSIEAAIRRIVERGARFVSRGDESGTHARERQLLALAGTAPAAADVVITGQGMSRTLRIASEIDAYTLTDEATFARLRQALRLQPVFQGGPHLLNTYAVLVDPARATERSGALAARLAEWLADGGGRTRIGSFRADEAGPVFIVWPADRPRDRPSDLPF